MVYRESLKLQSRDRAVSFHDVTAQVKEIAERKMPDLTANTIEAAISQVAGTCRSMGIVVVD